MDDTAGRTPLDWITLTLAAVEAFVGIAAVGGGLLLVAAPSGRLLGFSPGLLNGTPFGSYLFPGLVLLIVIGGSMLAAAIGHVQRRPSAALASIAAGVGLVGWIAVQVAFIGYVHPLQATMFACGIFILLLGFLDARRR